MTFAACVPLFSLSLEQSTGWDCLEGYPLGCGVLFYSTSLTEETVSLEGSTVEFCAGEEETVSHWKKNIFLDLFGG